MLVRAIAVLVCLLPAALAQSLEEDINAVLDVRTSQERRAELVKRIKANSANNHAALHQLAQRGLDGKLPVDVVSSVVVLAQVRGEKVLAHTRVDEVWTLIGDPPAFNAHLRKAIRAYLDDSAKRIPQ